MSELKIGLIALGDLCLAVDENRIKMINEHKIEKIAQSTARSRFTLL